MGSKKILFFFFSFFNYLNLIQSSYALHVRTLLPDHNLRVTTMLKRNSYGIDQQSAGNERSHVAASNKIAGGGGGHGGGSRGGSSHGGSDNGNGGNNGQGAGGAAVIPVVVAGAANNNRNHHGAATRNCITLPVLLMINMASLIFLCIRMLN